MARTKIGYVCGRGHYCFYEADSEEGGQCSGKSVGDIYVEWSEESGRYGETHEEILQQCDESLAQKYDVWRSGGADERPARIKKHNESLEEALNETFSDGTSILEYVLATHPSLRQRFQRILDDMGGGR